MRADRLLSILLLLQRHRRLTAQALAEKLEVSERTIYRDMEALGAAGIPVVAGRGRGGGWSLPGQYRTTLTGLTGAEIQALFVAGPPRLLADLRLDRAAEAALLKLLAALPPVFHRGAEDARQRIHLDVTGWNRSDEAVPLLPVLQEAIWGERQVHLTYRRGEGGDAVERVADPLGLVAKGSVWYLVAAVEGDVRSYRVSRLVDARVLEAPCRRPEGFDLAAYWEHSSAAFRAALPRYHAVLRAHPDLLPRLGYAGRYAHLEAVAEPDAGGWRTVTMRFQTEDEAAEYALGFGTRIEVLDPPTLRADVAARAAAVAAFYQERGSKHA